MYRISLRVLLFAIGVAWLTLGQALAVQTLAVQAHCVAEVTLNTDHKYSNPFTEVTLDAIVKTPDGHELRLPGFWDGGGRWKFRYSSGVLGTHSFVTDCSDKNNPQLNGVTGAFKVTPYVGDDPLYQHGPIQVAPDHQHFQQEDGKPFFWLGDTWWKGLSKRIPIEGFKELTEDRKTKGFTVVQIVAGPYPDEPAFDPRWENEAGMPYEGSYQKVNPAYFDAADNRIGILIDAGIMPAIVGGWGWHMPAVGVENFVRHWRYLIARYGAYPVVWIIGGEAGGEQWTAVARAVRKMDPFHRLITLHPYNTARRAVTDESVLDFDMMQTGHGDWGAAGNTVSKVTSSYSKTPPMPVLVGEVTYEGHMMSNREDLQRFMFWTCILNGAAGHTYGAGGIWQMNSETERGAEYELTPWFKAMKYPGSTELGLGKKLLEEYPWWRFGPHPEWVEPHSTVLLEPHSQWYDDNQLWANNGGRYDLPYAAGIPGGVRFIYIPGGHPYDWGAPKLTRLDPGVSYHAYFFDPVWGTRYELGTLTVPIKEGAPLADNFDATQANEWTDYGSPTTRRGGQLIGQKGMVTVLNGTTPLNAQAEVDAKSDSEAGIILRYHDANNYLVALYSPLLHAIYIHDRKNGEWGDQLGKVSVPNIGPSIHLSAAVVGDSASLTVTDGTQSFTTWPAKVKNMEAGNVGLWHFQIGDTQSFSRFTTSRVHVKAADSRPKGEPLVLHENPGMLPAIELPDISLLLTDSYQPPRLPSPQDWVLVLEPLKG